MKTWLHFIGKSYYSRASFEAEAREHGITRRVSLRTAKRMEFGDSVLLAMRDGKSALLFGQFAITRLTGLTVEAMKHVATDFPLEMIHPGGGIVSRGCGDIGLGPAFSFTSHVEMEDLVEKLEEQKAQGGEVGAIMVGGAWQDFPLVRLKSVPHQKGFRLFDQASLADDVVAWMLEHPDKALPQIRGHFYAKPDDFVFPLPDDIAKELGVFTSYDRLEQLKEQQKQQGELGL